MAAYLHLKYCNTLFSQTVTRSGCQPEYNANKHKKVQMVLLPHSAFIGLEGFYIIESAEILHDYHNVPLKNASSMITATRNYIQCLSASCVICRHVTISENFPIERLAKSQSLLIIQLYGACSTQNAIR